MPMPQPSAIWSPRLKPGPSLEVDEEEVPVWELEPLVPNVGVPVSVCCANVSVALVVEPWFLPWVHVPPLHPFPFKETHPSLQTVVEVLVWQHVPLQQPNPESQTLSSLQQS